MRITRPRTLLVLLAIVLLAVAAWFVSERPRAVKATQPTAIPVSVIAVKREDVPRYLSAIGTVQSLHSVVIRPQVEGVLTRIAVQEGQTVREGDLLATLDDRAIRASLDQARAQLKQSQAQLQVAQVDLKRYRLLSEDNGISRQTLDQQQALVNQLDASILGNQASIAAAEVQLSYTRVLSPVSGRVGIRNVDEGNLVRSSDTQGLFSVTRMDPIAVEFSVPQQWLPTLQQLVASSEPAPIKAYLEGDGDSSGTLLGEGRLSLIDNQIAAGTGTLRAKATFSNADARLWPGQLVSLRVQTGVERDALVVPPGVVRQGVDQHFVYRISGDKAEAVPVKVLYQDSRLNVISGVDANDRLVADGQSRLKPGATVEVLDTAPAAENVARSDASVQP
ncbi:MULTISPECIES: efflux RND transporter periplasmic adaptor subunit [unclassified Pseudomonas]|uniref:efflux RND transporter periplasmic adaptor subunit n=1 Tax=unclassified Pseudomonas TaxID=196821 RepID=UPI0021C6EC0A|nr:MULTISPECIES: efflux RND transporter periplasmic adaptor subunit [unclassified Pseudomonas]MCU1732996.1 efflux RND transporter periplasmic adaptor subunit [Pseudomonas sp. 20P_3.2_Bac4]MCU1743377.1 efflux RND transporter periplasmic adaptor subunit [Pseudomonas sp. 20P_3.2_Bac5]